MGELVIKATLKGDEAKKFEAIKEKHGVRANSEVLRICITNCYENLEATKRE